VRPIRSDAVESVRELAPAKINLTLEVAGRRSDGFHELASLVAFADVGDSVTLHVGDRPGVTTTGPFAGSLTGPNILEQALALIGERAPRLVLGSVHLDKHLPVAAGIGGGSADAGALLRAVRRANGAASEDVDWHGVARALGADVPVCFAARPAWMTGVGDALAEVAGGLPQLAAVLVNPLSEVPADKTARVFRALGAGALRSDYVPPAAPRFADRMAVLDFMRTHGNDLACAAEAVVPEIGPVLAALGALPDCAYAAVSGAGPTCFGIFPDADAACAAREALASKHPDWWAMAVTLG
jgi:4-diphosphocytidyl-2-C-methyl-D-erythritol kinase